MTWMDRLEFAKEFSKYAHSGQKDRAGNPYYLHPLAISEKLESDDERIVALLHDVLRYTDVTLSTVKNLFGATIGGAVRAITRRDGERFDDYIARVSQNPLAKSVKIADLEFVLEMRGKSGAGDSADQRMTAHERALKFLKSIGTADMAESEGSK